MALRVNTDQQAFYIYEPAGHNVPAMNAAWTILGEVVVHSDVNLPSIIVTRYLDGTPTGWAGSYYASDGSTHYIYINPGTGQVSSGAWTMGPGRYSYSIHHNGANLVQVRIDGVLVLEFTATVNAGTNGARSVQWGGFGTPMLAGYMDSTWQRWRMWTADLTPLECFFEFRSATPVRTSGLIHDWPMDAGSGRLDDTVSGQPDLLDNPSFPLGDGTDIPLQTGYRVYYGAAGTSASGTASCTPAYPSGISASTSDLWCEVTGRSNDAGTAFGVPAGWTLVTDSALEGGTGTWAADTGTRRVALYKKDTVAGTETGTISVTLGGAVTTNNTLRATIFRTERPIGTTLQVSATTGADTTNGTGFSATGSASIAFDVGDLVMVGVAQNIDTGTQSAVSLTATGIEFAPRQNVRSDAVTNGNDHRHILDAFHVMSGTATVAPVYAYTISAAGSGPANFVRMRATAGSAELVISGCSHGHTAENVVLTTSTTLAIDSATHAHSAGALTLSTGTALVVDNASHAHSADALTLSTGLSLTIADATHEHTAQALTLTTDSTLAIASATHAHAAGAVVLTTDSTLAVASATHGHTAENLTLDTALSVDLVIAGATHAHSAQSLTLATASTTLAVDNATHGHTAGSLALTLDTTLAIANATHAHAADNATLSTTGGTFLTVADAVHAHTAGNVALTTDSTLAIQGATHAHTAENVGLSQAVSLVVANASHGHSAANVVLTVTPGLLIADATHAHSAGSPILSIEAWLAVADAWHSHIADSPTLQLVGVDFEVEDRFIAKATPRNWVAKNSPRNWEVRR